ncbi:MAG: transposase [Candidatus Glassbacteria bacterium]|nr:transposase [Candidatus Glassbacteria bacterium]
MQRRSPRLQGYDYSSPGAYFVTVCTYKGRCILGEVVDGVMRLNDAGRVVSDSWRWLENQYTYVKLDEFIIMPNHIHGILLIINECRGRSRTAPTGKRKPLGRLIGAFKTISTKRINQMRGTPGMAIWQRSYYERVVRRTDRMDRIRKYIINNPARWVRDHGHAESPSRDIVDNRSM